MLHIESIAYKCAIYEWRTIKFDSHINVLHSNENTRGKTTVLRILLYMLGFKIPDIKNVDFSQMQFEIKLTNAKNERVVLKRCFENAKDVVKVTLNGAEESSLPFALSNQYIRETIFCIDEPIVQENILGVFYIDQERGWSLLNRGKVVGNIAFSIEELLCGLGQQDISALKEEKDKLNSDISEYNTLLCFADMETSAQRDMGMLAVDSSSETRKRERDALAYKISRLNKELNELQEVLSKNESLLQLIEKVCLRVRIPDGSVINVTKDNIENCSEPMDYLKARIAILKAQKCELQNKYDELQGELELQLGEYSNDELLKVYKSQIHQMDLSYTRIEEAIKKLETQRREVNRKIKEYANNGWSHKISANIINYLKRLKSKHNYNAASNVVLTDRLSPYSGAEFSKRVLAFRFAYLKAIDEAYGIKLPIIIDSPYAKEIDGSNFKRVVEVLEEDFSEHQIIIASIRDEVKPAHLRIQINQGVLEEDVTYQEVPLADN